LAQANVETILLKQLASCLRTPITLMGPGGTVLFYNEPAEPIYGMRFEESGGRDMGKALLPSDAAGTPLERGDRPIMIALDQRRPAHRRIYVQGGPHDRRELEVTGLPLTALDGRPLGALGLFWDPCDPVPVAEPLLADGQQEVETILTRRAAARLGAPIFLVDAAGRLLFYNTAAAAILGHPFDEMLRESRMKLYKAFASRDDDGNPIHPDDHPLTIAREERRPVHRRFWIRALDGHERKLACTAIPLIGQCDRLLGAVGAFWEARES